MVSSTCSFGGIYYITPHMHMVSKYMQSYEPQSLKEKMGGKEKKKIITNIKTLNGSLFLIQTGGQEGFWVHWVHWVHWVNGPTATGGAVEGK